MSGQSFADVGRNFTCCRHSDRSWAEVPDAWEIWLLSLCSSNGTKVAYPNMYKIQNKSLLKPCLACHFSNHAIFIYKSTFFSPKASTERAFLKICLGGLIYITLQIYQ